MDKKQIKKLVSFFFEAGTLRKIPRGHQQVLLMQDFSDNIASHSFRVALIGYFLAENVGADSGKVVKMCLFHDLEEARTGDQNWLHKSYIRSFEGEVREDQVQGIKNTDEFKKISREYDGRKTLEAKVAKDADYLDQIILLKEYMWQGSKEAEDWLHLNKEGENEAEKRLNTQLARKLAEEIKRQNPSDWWQNHWSPHKREN